VANGRAQFLLNLRGGSQPEAKVTNKEWLESFFHCGSWIRLVTAHDQHRTLARKDHSQIERYAAVVAVYESLGMLIEDVVTNLVAWAAWARNQTLSLADLNEQIVLSANAPEKVQKPNTPYHLDAVQLLSRSKRTRIDPQHYIASLVAMKPEELLAWLGLLWSPQPGESLVPQDCRYDWETLPSSLHAIVQVLADPAMQLTTTTYNKLKHGPQVVLMNVRDVAIKKRRLPWELADRLPEGEYMRLLFAGATTQEEHDMAADGQRVAPFILHDIYFVDVLLFEVMFPLMLLMRRLARWLYRYVFGEVLIEKRDCRVTELVQQAEARFAVRYPKR
jgi:hypothetical protein